MSRNTHIDMDDIAHEHFRSFASDLEQLIKGHGGAKGKKASIAREANILELCRLENEFKLALIERDQGRSAYAPFCDYFVDVKKNVLTARPYFRERQSTFTESISLAIKSKAWRQLLFFKINFPFATFVMRSPELREVPQLVELYEKIGLLRTKIVETNLPLAISRSKIFWNKMPKSHLSFLDMIQISSEGLIAAVDKFVPSDAPDVFAPVAIGRMTGNVIDAYSETVIHFYPSDKRKLYRANKFNSRQMSNDFSDMADFVNHETPEKNRTTTGEIADLMAAASVISTGDYASGHSSRAMSTGNSGLRQGGLMMDAGEDVRPDVQMERAELSFTLAKAIETLSVFERKILRLKGVIPETNQEE